MNILPGTRPAWYPLPRDWRAHAISTLGTVLLETAGGERDDHISFLFTEPLEVLHAATPDEFRDLLSQLDTSIQNGHYIAGAATYEAGLALQNVSSRFPAGRLATFGVYADCLRFDHRTGTISGRPPRLKRAPDSFSLASPLHNPGRSLSDQEYEQRIAAIQSYLAAGDTYQVNFTLRFRMDYNGAGLDLYERLIERQPVDYAAIANLDGELVLSFSPELFFRTRQQSIITRPMKGTASRHSEAILDRERAAALVADEKNRAEHVMIVDLLRNDLGRICETGSVTTRDLFRVETYATLHQMTSVVSGTLQPGTGVSDIFHALFPSGSITGAPKRRTMQIIDELEEGPRGIYTGTIGFAGPESSCFNVAIRTLTLRGPTATFGAGGGIVADSTAKAELSEVDLKASFLESATQHLGIIETLRYEDGYPLLELHLARLKSSAYRLGLAFDRDAILRALPTNLASTQRVRILLSPAGPAVQYAPLTGKDNDLRVRIAARRILSTAPELQHKTTRRAFYDTQLRLAQNDGYDEILFLNQRDEFAEGAISNIFLQIGDVLYTPPLAAGALPGVLRSHLLATRADVQERTLRLEDISSASAAFVGNALRGLRLIGSLEFE